VIPVLMLYRVEWLSVTGATGHGSWMSKAAAESWAAYGNAKYPGIFHRAVPMFISGDVAPE
jgi:hypothetical protein